MIVLVVLVLSLLIFRGIGALGVDALATWPAATRFALATMLTVTASAHFTKMREDLIRMVPGWVSLAAVCSLSDRLVRIGRSCRIAYTVLAAGSRNCSHCFFHSRLSGKCESSEERSWP